MPNLVQVAGVVLRDESGKYLLVQEKQESAFGLWGLPAGHVDEGEEISAAAIREACEETGFEVQLVSNEPVFVSDEGNPDRVKYAFQAKVVDGTLAFPEDEILDAQWLSLSDIKALMQDGKLRSPWVLNSIMKVEDAHNRH